MAHETTLQTQSAHGTCTTQLFTPAGAGPWPAVILCFDAFGARPAISEIAARLADAGYVVAVPDLFYRVGSPFVLKPELPRDDAKPMFALFGDPKLGPELMTRWLYPTLSNDHLRDAVGPVLTALEAHPSVRGGIGTMGYCMGGNAALRLAAIFGDRVRATASFHGGFLVSPAPDSPHLQLAHATARLYIAGAIEDDSFTDAAKATLIAALEAAGRAHTVETYPGRHGFAVRDNPAYDPACAARHDQALRTFFGAALGG